MKKKFFKVLVLASITLLTFTGCVDMGQIGGPDNLNRINGQELKLAGWEADQWGDMSFKIQDDWILKRSYSELSGKIYNYAGGGIIFSQGEPENGTDANRDMRLKKILLADTSQQNQDRRYGEIEDRMIGGEPAKTVAVESEASMPFGKQIMKMSSESNIAAVIHDGKEYLITSVSMKNPLEHSNQTFNLLLDSIRFGGDHSSVNLSQTDDYEQYGSILLKLNGWREKGSDQNGWITYGMAGLSVKVLTEPDPTPGVLTKNEVSQKIKTLMESGDTTIENVSILEEKELSSYPGKGKEITAEIDWLLEYREMISLQKLDFTFVTEQRKDFAKLAISQNGNYATTIICVMSEDINEADRRFNEVMKSVRVLPKTDQAINQEIRKAL